MTALAKRIHEIMKSDPSTTAEDMLAMNIGTTVFEVEFIMEQIKQRC